MRASPFSALLLATLLVGCGTNPVTGKSEIQFVSEAAELRIGAARHGAKAQERGTFLQVGMVAVQIGLAANDSNGTLANLALQGAGLGARRRLNAHEIALGQFHAVVTQDVVRRGVVKKEIGNRKTSQVAQPCEFEFTRTTLELNLSFL